MKSYNKLFNFLLISLFFFSCAKTDNTTYNGNVMEFGEMKHQIFYDSEIDREHIAKIGEAFTEVAIFNERMQNSIQVRKESVETYNVYLSIDKSNWENSQLIAELRSLSEILNEFVPKIKFRITLVSQTFDEVEEKALN